MRVFGWKAKRTTACDRQNKLKIRQSGETDVKELTPALVNLLIERIDVHNNDKYDGHCHVKVNIYFTVVGMMNVPDEKEIQAMMEEVKNNPKTLKYVS